jgi:hypothetical protein
MPKDRPQKTPKECAHELLAKGGDGARAVRYSIGYGAGLEKRRPGTADQFMRKSKPRETK